MRSSKSRSRGKGNRNRSPSNNINRVFDSSGPEGKVRGTPQQIIDKYGQLARDAFLANDRVAGENFQQHAEHYSRLLSEAQRDAEAKRQNNQNNQQGGGKGGNDRNDRDAQRREEKQRQKQVASDDPGSAPQPDVIDTAGAGDSGLVETPEAAPKAEEKPKKPRTRKPRAKKPAEDAAQPTEAPADGGEAPEAAE